MPHRFNEKERRWLEIQEAHYRSWVRDHRFFNALIGRHPILYPAMGVLIGLAMLLLALLLFSAAHPRFGYVFRYVAFFLMSLGGVFLVFSTLLLLIGLLYWVWNQVRLIFRQ
ncbi:MAG TPA: hypothetical protein DCP08_08865 [Chloroflexi bacterium]|nr:hypothetical protein [Chloroflexota bacterium]